VNTLLVDCDPQSNATSGLGLVKDPERLNTYHLLVGATLAEEAVQATALEQLWLVPAHKNLIGANLELVETERREFRLRDALAPLYARYQFVVLDCPPALDLLTLNALVAADAVLIPMQASILRSRASANCWIRLSAYRGSSRLDAVWSDDRQHDTASKSAQQVTMRSIVSNSSLMPSSAKYSACIGIRTASAATSAFSVSRSSAGGQSSTTN